MKMKIFAMAFLLISTSFLWSQDDKLDSLDLSFESTPIREENIPYFAIAGGFNGTFFFANFDEINALIKTNFPGMGNNFFSGSIFMPGAEGFTAIGLVPNMRLSFFGAGGSKNIKKADTVTTRSMDFSLSFNGISIDYTYVPFRRFAIIPGVNIGWGTLGIEYQETRKAINWIDVKENVPGNYMSRLEAGFWQLQPHLNIEFAIAPFFAVRGSAGYSISFMGGWTYNKNAALDNVPKNVNASGLYAQFGVFIGLFNY